VSARVLKNGDVVAATRDPEALTGALDAVLAHTARVLAQTGEALRPGDVVITGSVVPPMPVAPGDDVVAELPPLGTLRVSFS
jgi:2-keto-4-pentenoate hydratase